jgi:hypothetical protein
MPVVPPCANRDERIAAKSVLIRSLVGVAEQREQQVETERSIDWCLRGSITWLPRCWTR